MLYGDVDVLSEEVILEWFAEAQKSQREGIWQKAAPFVKWLQEAEEESDDDDDEDEDDEDDE